MQFDTKDVDPKLLCLMCEERLRKVVVKDGTTTLDDCCEVCLSIHEQQNREEAAYAALLDDCKKVIDCSNAWQRKEALARIIHLMADPTPRADRARMVKRIAGAVRGELGLEV